MQHSFQQQPITLSSQQQPITSSQQQSKTLSSQQQSKTLSSQQQSKTFELLNEGTYGCVYKPNIPCSNDNDDEEIKRNERNKYYNKYYKNKNQYISKIQRKTSIIENEELLGKQIIEKIPHYSYRFSPILKTCPIQLNFIHSHNQCDLIKEEEEKEMSSTTTTSKNVNSPSPFISSKIKYVGKNDLMSIITLWNIQLPFKTFALKILDTLEFLMESINQLDKIHIVHNDIKENNIIYDENNSTFVIIDFGLSFNYNSTLKEYDDDYDKCNIIYSKESYYSIEHQMIGYIIKKPAEIIITESTINNIITEYFKNNEIWKSNEIFTAEEINIIINVYQTKAEKWKNKTRTELFTLLFRDFQCWDLYSLFISYLFHLQYNTNKQNLYIYKIIKILKNNIFKDDAETQSDYIQTIRDEITELKQNIYNDARPGQDADMNE